MAREEIPSSSREHAPQVELVGGDAYLGAERRARGDDCREVYIAWVGHTEAEPLMTAEDGGMLDDEAQELLV